MAPAVPGGIRPPPGDTRSSGSPSRSPGSPVASSMLLKHLYPGYKYPATKMARLAIVLLVVSVRFNREMPASTDESFGTGGDRSLLLLGGATGGSLPPTGTRSRAFSLSMRVRPAPPGGGHEVRRGPLTPSPVKKCCRRDPISKKVP